MGRILILSGYQLVDNPRVVKEADALTEAGHQVTVIHALTDLTMVPRTNQILAEARWSHHPLVDISRDSIFHRINWLWVRIRVRFWKGVLSWINWENPNQLGYFVPELLSFARKNPADLIIVHLESALWAGYCLLREGWQVAADFEDWYSEDGLPEDRANRPQTLMKRCESLLLQKGVYVTTTSEVLSQALTQAYGASCKPIVIHNSFPLAEADLSRSLGYEDRRDTKIPSIVWCSQRIGPGRGLEILCDAVIHLDHPMEIHLRGQPRPNFEETLRQRLPEEWQKRLFFHPQVHAKELPLRLMGHDIGFCGELDQSANKNLTISNKMFDYLRCGLAIVASDTVGQKEIAEKVPKAIFTFAKDDPKDLARVLNSLLANSERLCLAGTAARVASEDHYHWENTAQDLQKLVAEALAGYESIS